MHFIELCQALNANICHRVAGLINAINNCVGLLEEPSEKVDKNIKLKALLLMSDSSTKLVNKLNFFSYLYGISGKNEKVNVADLEEILNNLLN